MLYNSFQFLWLLPLILVAYYFLPILFVPLKISKTIVANRLLLIVSYALYMQWNPAYALILLGVTAETYLFALWIGNTVGQWRRKFLLISCGIGLALLPLLVFKYYNFITSSFASLFGWGELPGLNWAIPVGISFFTFQAVGYLFVSAPNTIGGTICCLYLFSLRFCLAPSARPLLCFLKSKEKEHSIRSKQCKDWSKYYGGCFLKW